eukprot:TRINITY_DN29515_c0_g1_i1.p1 TRINITY_DN29515_c0_g1~~TRINITY_DN29515_c0_g1_i1.p1  ORF type:complete len:1526 (-),score=381.17 TRINITY_DN29515_c0_g1_i1:80-4657(-)
MASPPAVSNSAPSAPASLHRLPSGTQPLNDIILQSMTSVTVQKLQRSASLPSSDAAAVQIAAALASVDDLHCPLEELGKIQPPPWAACNEKDTEGTCQACLEKKPIPRVCSSCEPHAGLCRECLCKYLSGCVKDAMYAVPMILCALCRERLPTVSWMRYVPPKVRDQYLGNAEQLLALRCPDCDETTSFFAGWPTSMKLDRARWKFVLEADSASAGAETAASPCRSRLWMDLFSMRFWQPRPRGEFAASLRRSAQVITQAQREDVWTGLLHARKSFGLAHEATCSRQRHKALMKLLCKQREESQAGQAASDASARAAAARIVGSWRKFDAGTESADAFVASLYGAYPPGIDTWAPQGLANAMKESLPLCIEDPERRLAAQLAWLRHNPKVRTPCCCAQVCFKCKVRGWHPGKTCEERQRREVSRHAMPCPNCGVPTTLSDGCSSIRCLCGHEWTWPNMGDGPDGADDEEERESDSAMSDSNGSDEDVDVLSNGSADVAADAKHRRNAIELCSMLREPQEGKEGSATRILISLLKALKASKSKEAKAAEGPKEDANEDYKTEKARAETHDAAQPVWLTSRQAESPDGASNAIVISSSPADPRPPPERRGASVDLSAALRRAINARNPGNVRELLAHGVVPGEAEVQCLGRISSNQDRKALEQVLLPAIDTLPRDSWPLWLKIQYGNSSSSSSSAGSAQATTAASAEGKFSQEVLSSRTGIGTAALRALRRQPDANVKAKYGRLLRDQLGNDWFEVARAGAATSELVGELSSAANAVLPRDRWLDHDEAGYRNMRRATRKELDRSLLEELLAMGADPLMPANSSADHCGRDSDSEGDEQSNVWFGGRFRRPNPVRRRREGLRRGEDDDDDTDSAASGSSSEGDTGSASSFWAPSHSDTSISACELLAICADKVAPKGGWNDSGQNEQQGSKSCLLRRLLGLEDERLAVGQCSATGSVDMPKTAMDYLGCPRKARMRLRQQHLGRLLSLAIGHVNLLAVQHVLEAWDGGADGHPGLGGPLPAAAWRALRSVICTEKRRALEDLLTRFLACRPEGHRDVPLRVLIQLGKRKPPDAVAAEAALDGLSEADKKQLHFQYLLHEEALSFLENILKKPTDDDGDLESQSEISDQIDTKCFIALRRCQDELAQTHISEFLQETLGEEKFKDKRKVAATVEALRELRQALWHSRPPDKALAIQLLSAGANLVDNETEEAEDAGNPDDEDPWHPRAWDVGAGDLVVRNPHADSAAVIATIDRLWHAKRKSSSGKRGAAMLEFSRRLLVKALRAANVEPVQAVVQWYASSGQEAPLLSKETLECYHMCRQRFSKEKRLLLDELFAEERSRLVSGGVPKKATKQIVTTMDLHAQITKLALEDKLEAGHAQEVREDMETSGDLSVRCWAALRRCRKAEEKEAITAFLKAKLGEEGFRRSQRRGASWELVAEMRNALIYRFEPDENLVEELLALGADVQDHWAEDSTRLEGYGSGLSDDDDGDDDEDGDESSDSEHDESDKDCDEEDPGEVLFGGSSESE